MSGTLKTALLDALAVLLPIDCAGCGAPDRSLCERCLAELQPSPVVRRAGQLTVHAALRYEGVARSTILAFKQSNRTDVAAALSRSLAASICAALEAALCEMPGCEIVGVPSSRPAYRERGFDPVAVLLGRSGFRSARELVVARNAEHQKALGADARALNRSGALRARRALEGRAFVIVDDVVTTGATLADAGRAIRDAGGTVVGFVTLAFTPLRSDSSDEVLDSHR